MTIDKLFRKTQLYLNTFCKALPDRSVGSEGNREATSLFEKELSLLGWETELAEFDAIDWEGNGAILKTEDRSFNVFVSPFSLDFKGEASLVSASTIHEIETAGAGNRILLLHGNIAREQLMPKNFVFYNPDEHRKIISALEQTAPAAIISATEYDFSLYGMGEFRGVRKNARTIT
jgi:aminopeptidase YwaD